MTLLHLDWSPLCLIDLMITMAPHPCPSLYSGGQYTARFIKIFSVSSSNMKVGDAIEKLADLRGEASMFKKKHDFF